MNTQHRFVRFGPFVVDRARRQLFREGSRVPVTPLPTAVLLVLLDRPGQAISKEELIALAWTDARVEDGSVYLAIRQLRAIVGCQADGSRMIETIKSVGYCFAAECHSFDEVPPELAPSPRRSLAPSRASADSAVACAGDRGIGSAHEDGSSNLDPYTSDAASEDLGSGACELNAEELDALMDNWLEILSGRAALETLNRDQVEDAIRIFSAVVARQDPPANAHTGLAMALFMRYESTRADRQPDGEALRQAERHARIGCQREPKSAEAWSTLALVKHRLRQSRQAVAAARVAVRLEKGEWRHWVRLAYVSGGAERLRAAEAALQITAQNGLAHWLAATVVIARGMPAAVSQHLVPGVALQDLQRPDPGNPGTLTAVGLHLLYAMVLAAAGDASRAREEALRELTFEHCGHVFVREACANAWYLLGILALRAGDRDAARHAFTEALARVPGLVPAGIALCALDGPLDLRVLAGLAGGGSGAPAATPPAKTYLAVIAQAIALTWAGRRVEAARLCLQGLKDPALRDLTIAWILPVEPTLIQLRGLSEWDETLAYLAHLAA